MVLMIVAVLSIQICCYNFLLKPCSIITTRFFLVAAVVASTLICTESNMLETLVFDLDAVIVAVLSPNIQDSFGLLFVHAQVIALCVLAFRAQVLSLKPRHRFLLTRSVSS